MSGSFVVEGPDVESDNPVYVGLVRHRSRPCSQPPTRAHQLRQLTGFTQRPEGVTTCISEINSRHCRYLDGLVPIHLMVRLREAGLPKPHENFFALSPEQWNLSFAALTDPLYGSQLAESLPVFDDIHRLRLSRNRVIAIEIGQDRAHVGVERLDLAPIH